MGSAIRRCKKEYNDDIFGKKYDISTVNNKMKISRGIIFAIYTTVAFINFSKPVESRTHSNSPHTGSRASRDDYYSRVPAYNVHPRNYAILSLDGKANTEDSEVSDAAKRGAMASMGEHMARLRRGSIAFNDDMARLRRGSIDFNDDMARLRRGSIAFGDDMARLRRAGINMGYDMARL